MKKIYFLLFLSALFLQVRATSYSFSPNSTLVDSISLNNTREFDVNINNTSGSAITLSWQKASSSVLAAGWGLQLCDNVACNTSIPSAQQNMASIAPGAHGFFKLTITAPTTIDSMVLKLMVWDPSGTGVDTVIFKINSIVGTRVNENPFATGNFSVYPNPAKDVVGLQFRNDPAKIKTLAIFDILGNSVMNFDENSKTDFSKINISMLPPGVYILKAMDKDGITINRRFYKSNN